MNSESIPKLTAHMVVWGSPWVDWGSDGVRNGVKQVQLGVICQHAGLNLISFAQ